MTVLLPWSAVNRSGRQSQAQRHLRRGAMTVNSPLNLRLRCSLQISLDVADSAACAPVSRVLALLHAAMPLLMLSAARDHAPVRFMSPSWPPKPPMPPLLLPLLLLLLLLLPLLLPSLFFALRGTGSGILGQSGTFIKPANRPPTFPPPPPPFAAAAVVSAAALPPPLRLLLSPLPPPPPPEPVGAADAAAGGSTAAAVAAAHMHTQRAACAEATLGWRRE